MMLVLALAMAARAVAVLLVVTPALVGSAVSGRLLLRRAPKTSAVVEPVVRPHVGRRPHPIKIRPQGGALGGRGVGGVAAEGGRAAWVRVARVAARRSAKYSVLFPVAPEAAGAAKVAVTVHPVTQTLHALHCYWRGGVA